MKTIFVYLATCLAIHTVTGTAVAQGAAAPGAPPSRASAEFNPPIGQLTNSTVSAREVTWDGTDWRKYVFFSTDKREVVVASSTNQVCFLHGRLFAVTPAVQGFWIEPSAPLGANELTGGEATSIANQSIRAAGFSTVARRVDLTNLLKQERELKLAQMLTLRSVELKAHGEKMTVIFESYTGLRGTAVLNEGLELVSSGLTSR